MRIIDLYLVKQIVRGLITAALVLLPLFSFLDFVEQLEDVGKGFYEINDAIMHVILTTPRRFIQLVPFIALLGNVAALGRLAASLELTAIRSSGYSPLEISKAVMTAGLLLLAFNCILEQFIAPPMHQSAIALRASALEQRTELGQNLGIWTRDETQILRIANIRPDTLLTSVEILRLGGDDRLEEYIHAEGFRIESPTEWTLYEVSRKKIEGGEVLTTRLPSLRWRTFLKPAQISTLTKPPESLSPVELYRYVSHLRETGQDSDSYALVFWRKIGIMVTTAGMLLFSIPFVLGSVRTGLANRLVLASLTGVGVYLADQIIANAGLLLGLSLPLVALLPGLLLLTVSRLWLAKVD